MKMEPIVSSETSAIRTQTPGNYPKRNKLQLLHSLRVIMTGIVCLVPVIECKPPRHATYDATLAERREESRAGAYRSSSKKKNTL